MFRKDFWKYFERFTVFPVPPIFYNLLGTVTSSHKVHICILCIEYHSVCPLVGTGTGTPPPLLLQLSVPHGHKVLKYIEYRTVSGVSELPNYWPPILLRPACVSSPCTKGGGWGGGANHSLGGDSVRGWVNIRKTPDIWLVSYSIIPLRCAPLPQRLGVWGGEGVGESQFRRLEKSFTLLTLCAFVS